MIHPTAIVDAGARLDASVAVGAFSIVGPDVEIGAGSWIGPHVVIHGPTRIGRENRIFQFCSLGDAPQHVGYKGEPTRLVVGTDCDIREGVTMSTGTAADRGVTTVGNSCFFMVNSHVAHDCIVGDKVIFANNVLLGGHSVIGDGVVFGGGVAVRQFVRIGEGAMIVGLSGVRADVIPFGMAHGPLANLVGLNVVGMRRRGLTKADLHRVRAAYQALFFGDGEFKARIERVAAEYAQDALVVKIIEFVRAGKRPFTMAIKRGEAEDDA